ncbi:MAG: hypothetical protein KBS44_06320 [Clostridiales bacterium]|nr:hypothetical protein [Candidatus Coliplasma equi]
MDNFFLCKKGPLPQGFVFDDDSGEQVEVDITGATPDLIKFNSNFKPVVNSYVYVARDYVEDEEKGEVMQLTVTDQGGNPAFAFSYAKYLKLLGPDPEEYDCEKYTAAVLCIKTDDGVFDTTVNFLFYVDGDTVPYDDHRVSGTYEADAGWQYVVLDLEESIWWDGIFTGGLIMASIGADIDTVIRVSELALFEDFDAAESYAGAASGDTSDDTTDVLTDDTTASSLDDTTTAATTDDDTSAADTSAAAVDTTVAGITTAESGKSGCGGTIASFAIIAVISLGAISIKRKN